MEHIDRSNVRASQQVSSRKSTFDLNSYLSLPSDSRSYHFSPACFSPTASHDVRDLCPNSLFSFSATKVSLELPYRFHFPASSSHTFRFPSFFFLPRLNAIHCSYSLNIRTLVPCLNVSLRSLLTKFTRRFQHLRYFNITTRDISFRQNDFV